MNLQELPNYRLLDCGNFEKVEYLSELKVVRPAASAIWNRNNESAWLKPDIVFKRNSKGSGVWESLTKKKFEKLPLQCGPQKMLLQPTPFGHLGLFAEQMEYWQKITETVKKSSNSSLKVLNLFAYTGGSTIAAAAGGAEVVHVDASKTSVDWAKENARINQLEKAPIRWMVDDVGSFVKREIRRGNKYQAIILDPPTYGRGPKNQLWMIEEHLPGLIKDLQQILDKDFLFFHLSAHTPGISPLALQNLLIHYFGKNFVFETEEMKIKAESGTTLPSGTSCWMMKK